MDEIKDVDSTSGSASAGSGAINSLGGAQRGPSAAASASAIAAAAASGLQYSIPGILHFLQHEWSRFEMERGQWEVERAELQARIAFLQGMSIRIDQDQDPDQVIATFFAAGERKGQENLKNDLVRRIKMLEYALKQERAKYAKLKYGNDSAANAGSETSKPSQEDQDQGLELPPIDGENYIAVSNVNWRQGRQLLRQ